MLLIVFLAALSSAPALKANACDMHQKTEQPAANTAHFNKGNTRVDCCDHAHQQKGHCTHDNCTNNSCHPVSIYSLHAVHHLGITSPPAIAAGHRIGHHRTQLPSYAYSIWQPPRVG
ncbi:hypothetical protein [Niabella aurantiaca]|uniref:hypothetical protein n=1 Tax=Niabella aurantiaca TaxID=379900 RepID=UPI0012F7ADD4|nr:hypothetical protein [Niabella aurantiaca]